MTIVAWDGKTLAADKQFSTGGMRSIGTKVYRVPDGIVGFSGSADYVGLMLNWFMSGRVPAEWPETLNGGAAEALFVMNDGTALVYNASAYPLLDDETRFWAIGAGREYAMAAMHLGRSAKTAVKVACELSTNCGGGIDTLTLPKKK